MGGKVTAQNEANADTVSDIQEILHFISRFIANKGGETVNRESWSFRNLKAFEFSRHVYQPLIYFSNNEILKISPTPLNDGEREFVDDLKEFYRRSSEFIEDKELFLLRNQSKGKGVGFFEAGNFYPDFILWIIQDEKQYVCFIDPKGLTRVQGFDDPKVRFHKTVKDIQNRLGDPNVLLDSFIVSNTHRRDIVWWSTGNAPELEFANNHVLFQKDDKDTYISNLVEAVISTRH